MKMATILHGILLLIGAVLLLLGLVLFFSARKFRDKGVKTQATVIDNIPSRSTDDHGTSQLYTPLLEYSIGGKTFTYTPNSRSNPPAYDIGEKVPIVYRPDNHHDVRIVGYWGIYLGSNILFAFGLPMFLIGLGYFLFKYGII